MPVSRIPVVHKFGIISHSQRLELQERLLKQSYPEILGSRPPTHLSRNRVEISEGFIQQYNNAKTLDEREKMEEMAKKMLERVKRRAGLRAHGQHVNLPLAWTELSQLAQCKGKIQEDCLDVLIASLDQSSLEKQHIPALFFLAETMLYWLRTDVIQQPYLRTAEIKLLKMGQLVFTRLFYYHMAGQLQGENEFKNRLFTYLEGLSDCQDAYSPYPNALLSLRFIIEVGKIILADANIVAEDEKEDDQLSPLPQIEKKDASPQPAGGRKSRSPQRKGSSPQPPSPRSVIDSGHTQPDSNTGWSQPQSGMSSKQGEEARSVQSANSGALSSSVHDLSPTLWHSLDVWRCTNHLSGGLRDALKALAHCGSGLAGESWIDSTCSMLILGEASKTNLLALKVMQGLARGVLPPEPPVTPPLSNRSMDSEDRMSVRDDLEREDSGTSEVSSKPSLSDIFERSDEGDTESRVQRSDIASMSADSPSNDQGNGTMQSEVEHHDVKEKLEGKRQSVMEVGPQPIKDELMRPQETKEAGQSEHKEDGKSVHDGKPKPALRDPSATKLNVGREVSFEDNIILKSTESNNSVPVNSPDKLRNWLHEMYGPNGLPRAKQPEISPAELTGNGRASGASSVPTYTNVPVPNQPGLNGWHWETGIMFVEVLSDVCIHGSTSLIQKRALVGDNKEFTDAFRRSMCQVPLPSAGLLDLAFFHAVSEVTDGGCNDWSWRLRYGAIQSLVKICRSLANDKAKEGLRNVAWAALIRAHSVERDDRVLEALKVGQVLSDLETLTNKHLPSVPDTLGAKIAAGLAVTYLPPLPPAIEYLPTRKTPPPAKSRPAVAKVKPESRHPLRTSLREEILLATALYEPAPSFQTRINFDLRRIVEDQWRKELQEELDQVEGMRQTEIERSQRDEELRQRRLSHNKDKKLNKSHCSAAPSTPAGAV